jgi:hypothetical protein
LLNVFQSVEVRAPVCAVVAFWIEIAGVEPPLEAIGDVPETDETPLGDPEEAEVSLPLPSTVIDAFV